MFGGLASLWLQTAHAGTHYDFAWSAETFSATGTLELSSSVGVGDPFDPSDVLALDVELFDAATFVGKIDFLDFSAGGDALAGTRDPSSLVIEDLFLDSASVGFGCASIGCASGVVVFETTQTPAGSVDFGSAGTARASFVFTEVPEVDGQAWIALAAISALCVRARRPRHPGARS